MKKHFASVLLASAFTISTIGTTLLARQAKAQSSPRPYAVLVNGQGNCCVWDKDNPNSFYMSDVVKELRAQNAELRRVPYSNFDDGERSSCDWTSTDERFLRDGADFINNQLDRSRPLILIGHSYGGDSILSLLPRINRRIDFVAVIDPVSAGGLRATLGRHKVPSNVDYFFNRWQRNEPFPDDFWNDGRIGCDAKTCDQHEQPFSTNTDGTTVTQACEWFETCSRKNEETGHTRLPQDDWIEKTIGDKVQIQLAASNFGVRADQVIGNSGWVGSIAVADGFIYLATADGQLRRGSISDRIQTAVIGNSRWTGSIAVADGFIYLATADGRLMRGHLNP